MDRAGRELAVQKGIEQMKELLANQPDGYYIVPGVDHSTGGSDLSLVNYLVTRFSMEFHQYRWWTTESMWEKGIRINWQRK